jgi:hypothetical protein
LKQCFGSRIIDSGAGYGFSIQGQKPKGIRIHIQGFDDQKLICGSFLAPTPESGSTDLTESESETLLKSVQMRGFMQKYYEILQMNYIHTVFQKKNKELGKFSPFLKH